MMKITKIILVVLCFLPFSAKAAGYSAKDSVMIKDANSVYDRNLEKLITSWHPNPEVDDAELFTNIDSTKVLADRPDTFYINRLKKIPSVIGLTYNNVVKSCIQIYTVRKRAKFEQILGLKEYYFPMFEEVLDQYGLPLELKYLSVIESALNPRAVSHCGATGLWQFMFGTGRQYHMNIDTYVDDRRDAYAATHAAARFLKDLYGIYKDWVLVIAAYNCGPGNVNKAIRRSGGKTNYWDIYNYLPKETRGYFPAFIAATYSINFYKDHSLTPKYANLLPHSDTLVVKNNIHFQQIADVLGIPIQQLRDLNPQYRRDIIPGTFESCKLRLPSNYVSRFITYKDSIARYKSSEFFASDFKVINPGSSRPVNDLQSSQLVAGTSPVKKTHKVKKGETLTQIAKLYHVSADELKEWNNISSGKVKLGKTLVVYVPKKKAEEKVASKTIAKASKETEETTASTEAASKKTTNNKKEEKTSKTIAKASKGETDSNLDNSQSVKGQTSQVVAATSVVKKTHKVKKGETLTQVAKLYHVSTDELKEWNNITNGKVKAGKSLVVYVSKKKTEEDAATKTVAKVSKEIVETPEKVEATSKKNAKNKKDEKSAKTLAKTSKVEADKVTKEETESSEKTVAKNVKVAPVKKGKNKDEYIYYEVKKGDTLYKIASKYPGVTGNDLMAWNELNESNIHPGQTIKIKKVN
ncbi:MAG: LysM peptidoglycan-binding domain-containing protein [Bacteroidota bacterium]|nr:LysM peptidoglycan-binding domain-containing protein [Bacteroidota bacterium]